MKDTSISNPVRDEELNRDDAANYYDMEQAGRILFDGYVNGKIEDGIKRPFSNNQPKPYSHAEKHFDYIFGIVALHVVVVDIDDPDAFECRLKIAKETGEHCIVIRSTNRGGHFFWFNRDQKITVSNSHNKTGLTLYPVDYKAGIRKVKSTGEVKKATCAACLSHPDGKRREIIYANVKDDGTLDEIPFYDLPLKSGDEFRFLNMSSGDGRQESLFKYMIPVKTAGYSYEQFRRIAELAERFLFVDGLEDEFENAIRPEAWESINVASAQFGTGSKFQHNKFALYMIEKHHIRLINGQLHSYQNGVYVPGAKAIRKIMLKEIQDLRVRQQNEVLEFMNVWCEESRPCSFKYIAFNNGIYNIETNTLEAFDPSVIITNRIPWNYNPAAKSELVDTVLNRLACDDNDTRKLLEELAGACMYRSNTLGGGKMFILKGDKANGKSTYIDMLKAMLGTENYSTMDMQQIGERFNTAMLFGKLANLGDDISDQFVSDTSKLKKIVTGNSLQGEFKGEKPFDFTPYCTMVFSANDMPRTNDKTKALERRMMIVPMNATFRETDTNFDSEITFKLQNRESIEYFIQLALDGLCDVLGLVDGKKGFTVPAKSTEALETYSKENDPVTAFLDECDLDADVYNEPTKNVYFRFNSFCVSNGYKCMSKGTFSKRVNAALGTRCKDCRLPDGKKGIVFEKA